MKIIKHNSSELVIKEQGDVFGSVFTLIWTTFFSGIPLIIILVMLSNVGVTTLKCKRVEPTQVSCEKQESKFFGLVEQLPIKFIQVKSAKFKSKEGIDSEAGYTIDNWVTLVTSSGEVTFVEDFVAVNGVRGSASQMQEIATQINNFIQSNQPSLKIQRDLRADLWQSLFPIGFMSIFVLIGLVALFMQFRSEIIIFDKNNRRLIREQKSLLGKKYRYYSLDEIIEVDIKTRTDSDNDTFYELRLLPESTHKRKLMSSNSLESVKKIQIVIRDFLQLS